MSNRRFYKGNPRGAPRGAGTEEIAEQSDKIDDLIDDLEAGRNVDRHELDEVLGYPYHSYYDGQRG